jgi:hypothetical protein
MMAGFKPMGTAMRFYAAVAIVSLGCLGVLILGSWLKEFTSPMYGVDRGELLLKLPGDPEPVYGLSDSQVAVRMKDQSFVEWCRQSVAPYWVFKTVAHGDKAFFAYQGVMVLERRGGACILN